MTFYGESLVRESGHSGAENANVATYVLSRSDTESPLNRSSDWSKVGCTGIGFTSRPLLVLFPRFSRLFVNWG